MPTFRTIVTNRGFEINAAAIENSLAVIITQMAIGDGNGNPTVPQGTDTALVRERYRDDLNRLYQDPDDPTTFIAELIIPAATGGFVAREAGLFTADGELYAVANLPDIYKPTASEGAYADTVVRLIFSQANTSIITLNVDPNVAVATHTWVINNINTSTLIPGGLTGQILSKVSNADGDTEWIDPAGTFDVNVFTREENQTLAALQTVVTFAVISTEGLAVYIDGVRLREDEFTIDSATQITLDTAYAAGTKLTGVQNDQTGMTEILYRFNNLSELTDIPQARINLGIPGAIAAASINWGQLVSVPATFAPSAHTHIIGDVTGLQIALDAKAAIVHVHTIANTTGLQAALDGKSNTGHQHAIADVLLLQEGLNNKAGLSHAHAITDVTGLTAALDARALLSSFGNALTANGYQRLPGGLILQWGINTSSQGSGNGPTIMFPLEFPNSCLAVLITDKNVSSGSDVDATAQVRGTPSITSFQTYISSSSGGETWEGMYWFAIGK